MTAFKPGDKATVEVEVISTFEYLAGVKTPSGHRFQIKLSELQPTPPPAPKAERDAVPDDARVGDEYGDGAHAVRVQSVAHDGSYVVTAVAGDPCTGRCSTGCHARSNWRLISRGPAPVPKAASNAARCTCVHAPEQHNAKYGCDVVGCDCYADGSRACFEPAPVPTPKAKREWQKHDVVLDRATGEERTVMQVDRHLLHVHGDSEWRHEDGFTLLRPAPTPEQARPLWREGEVVRHSSGCEGVLKQNVASDFDGFVAVRISDDESGSWDVKNVVRVLKEVAPDPANFEVTRETVDAIFNEPPEPAKGMTAGRRFYEAFRDEFISLAEWSKVPGDFEQKWERIAATLAAQPASGEREILGYVVRTGFKRKAGERIAGVQTFADAEEFAFAQVRAGRPCRIVVVRKATP